MIKNNLEKIFCFALFFVCCIGCNPKATPKEIITGKNENKVIRFPSKAVNDTFSVFVSLPDNYSDKRKYPVVYLLDANLYFDIMAVTIKKYSEVGLLRPVILIGIGYKDFETMDVLRNRDLTFPLAPPEYDMKESGGGEKFYAFITNELIPKMDSAYFIDKTKRALMGHSLGGYFTLYALSKELKQKNTIFSGYIAASPSTHYNNNYILKEFEKGVFENSKKIETYVTFGGLEDEEDPAVLKAGKVIESLNTSLKKGTIFKGETFSNLDHMDTPLPSFIKGLQWLADETKSNEVSSKK